MNQSLNNNLMRRGFFAANGQWSRFMGQHQYTLSEDAGSWFVNRPFFGDEAAVKEALNEVKKLAPRFGITHSDIRKGRLRVFLSKPSSDWEEEAKRIDFLTKSLEQRLAPWNVTMAQRRAMEEEAKLQRQAALAKQVQAQKSQEKPKSEQVSPVEEPAPEPSEPEEILDSEPLPEDLPQETPAPSQKKTWSRSQRFLHDQILAPEEVAEVPEEEEAYFPRDLQEAQGVKIKKGGWQASHGNKPEEAIETEDADLRDIQAAQGVKVKKRSWQTPYVPPEENPQHPKVYDDVVTSIIDRRFHGVATVGAVIGSLIGALILGVAATQGWPHAPLGLILPFLIILVYRGMAGHQMPVWLGLTLLVFAILLGNYFATSAELMVRNNVPVLKAIRQGIQAHYDNKHFYVANVWIQAGFTAIAAAIPTILLLAGGKTKPELHH